MKVTCKTCGRPIKWTKDGWKHFFGVSWFDNDHPRVPVMSS